MSAYDLPSDIIIKTAQVAIIVPLFITVLRIRSLNSIQWLLFTLLLISVIISTISRFLWSIKENNLYLLHLYTILEFSGWAVIYYKLFKSNKTKKVVLSVAVFYLVLAIFNSVYLEPLDTFNANSRASESIILIVFSLAYFIKIFKEKKILHLEKDYSFWLNTSVLIYFSSSFLLFSFSNVLLNSKSYQIREVWNVHAIFLIIHYGLISASIWLISKKTKSI